ncbi:MAG: ArnT family glycosyltransferase [Candidatus Woesearchaeota archaeon]
MKRLPRIIVILVVLAFVLRLVPVFTSYFFWDETVYLQNAMVLSGEGAFYDELSSRPILLPLVLSVHGPIDIEVFARFVVALFGSLSVLVAYLFGRKYDEKTGVVAAMLMCVMPMHILFSRMVLTDVAAAMLMAASILVFLQRRSAPGWAGVLFGLSVLMKFTSVLALVVIALAVVAGYARLRSVIAFAFGGAVTIGPFLVWSAYVFGSPFSVFFEGYRVVDVYDPVSLGFVLVLIVQCFSLLLVGIAVSAYRVIRSDRVDRYSLVLFGWLAVMVLSFVFVLQKGVAMPPGLEWELARFLMPALIPGVVLAAREAARCSYRAIAVFGVVFVVINTGVYALAFSDPISHEDGLRVVSKEASFFLDEVLGEDAMIAADNWPVVAYYAQRSVRPVHEPAHAYMVLIPAGERGGSFDESFCAGSWCALVSVDSDAFGAVGTGVLVDEPHTPLVT